MGLSFDPAQDPVFVEMLRLAEQAIVTKHLDELEAFRALILALGHQPDVIKSQVGMTGQAFAYICPACKMAGTYTMTFCSETVRFMYEKTGKALTVKCPGPDEDSKYEPFMGGEGTPLG